MKRIGTCSAMLVVFAIAAGTARAQHAAGALIVTASNLATNQLLVFDIGGTLVQTIPTGGQGGVGGNAGGVAVLGRTVAVVNWGSSKLGRDGTPNPGQQDTNPSALQSGGGINVRGSSWIGFRGEIADALSTPSRWRPGHPPMPINS